MPKLRIFPRRARRHAGRAIAARKPSSPGLEGLECRRLLAAAFRDNELLVQFAPTADVSSRAAVRGTVNGQAAETLLTPTMRSRGVGPLERITIGNGMSVEQAAKAVARQPGVVLAEPNYVLRRAAVSNDPLYTTGSRLWGMYGDDVPTASGPPGTTNAFGSQAEKAWDAGYTGSRAVVVGVLDSGIDVSHPDLAANIWVNPFEVAGDGIDNDGNGYVDDINGWDFVNGDRTVFDAGEDPHGTHVAGTIGGVGGNGVGVAGVSWNVSMISAKFLGADGTGTLVNAIKALDYLTDLKTRSGVNIVASNNSWGGGGYSVAMNNAIIRGADAGILFVAAAGNGGSDGFGDDNDALPTYPANFSTVRGTMSQPAADYESVISVAAISQWGFRADYSNFGATTVDIAAPGSAIMSTLPGNAYGVFDGTSMAAPHVTGAIALYAAANPGATAAGIRAAMLGTAIATPSLQGRTVTGGRLDVFEAMNASPPVAPLNLTATAVPNTGRVALSWTAPSATARGPVTDYVVQYKRSSDAAWSTFDDGVSTETSAGVSGLVAGATYSFRVSATNVFGTGSSSAVATAAMPTSLANVTAGMEGSTLVVRFTPRDALAHVAVVTWTGTAYQVVADGTDVRGTFSAAGVAGIRVIGSVTNVDRVEFRAAATGVTSMPVGVEVSAAVELATIGLAIDTAGSVSVRAPARLSSSIRTAGPQRYLGPVTIAGNTSIDAGSATVAFGGAIDAAGSGRQNLSVSTGGAVRFDRAVGGTTPLGSLSVNRAAAATFKASVRINGQPVEAAANGLAFGPGVNNVDFQQPGSSVVGSRGSGLVFQGGSQGSLVANLSVTGCGGDGVLFNAGEYGGTGLASVASNSNRGAGFALRGVVTGVTLGAPGVGVSAQGNANGIELANGPSRVVIDSGLFSGNYGSGIRVTSALTNNITIRNSLVGVDATGKGRLGNAAHGILVSAAQGVSVQGTTVGANSQFGIVATGASRSVTISRSFIGVASDGTTPVGNGQSGVWALGGSVRTDVYDSTVAFNGYAGIQITDGAREATVSGNTIRNNESFGMSVSGDVGTTTVNRNVIVNNKQYGMYVNGARGLGVIENVIESNYQGIVIGGASLAPTSITGNTIRFNPGGGIVMIEARGLLVLGNTITDNTSYGIYMLGDSTGTVIRRNVIASDTPTGQSAGIWLNKVIGSSIGDYGLGSSAGNVIRNNAVGIYIDANSRNYFVTQNSIFNNGVGIQNLDPTAAPSLRLLSVSAATGSTRTVSFQLTASGYYLVEVFRTAAGRQGGPQGEVFVGSTKISIGTLTFSLQLNGIVAGDQVTATLSRLNSPMVGGLPWGTSSFSNGILVNNLDTTGSGATVVNAAAFALATATPSTNTNAKTSRAAGLAAAATVAR